MKRLPEIVVMLCLAGMVAIVAAFMKGEGGSRSAQEINAAEQILDRLTEARRELVGRHDATLESIRSKTALLTEGDREAAEALIAENEPHFQETLALLDAEIEAARRRVEVSRGP